MDPRDQFLKQIDFVAPESKSSHVSAVQTPGFHGCNVVIVEAFAGEKVHKGTGSLISTPHLVPTQEMVDFEWILTAAHCGSVLDEGNVRLCDRLRVHVPIESKWDDVQRLNNPLELFEDIIIPVVKNKTVFIYNKFLEFATIDRDLALIRIPRTSRPRRSPLKLLSETNIQSITVVGFPNTNGLTNHIPYLSKSTCVAVRPQTLKYLCDTFPGQIGGPICANREIIGIHVASDTNLGLLITEPIHVWIHSVCSEVNGRIFDENGVILQECLKDNSCNDDKLDGTELIFQNEPSPPTISFETIDQDNLTKSNLVEEIFTLLIQFDGTEKSIDEECHSIADLFEGFNDNSRPLRRVAFKIPSDRESLKLEIQNSFESLHKMDQDFAFQLSEGHELLQDLFKRFNCPIKVDSLMKIKGARKYNGQLVRIVEVLHDQAKARVLLIHSSKIIRIPHNLLVEPEKPSNCFEQFPMLIESIPYADQYSSALQRLLRTIIPRFARAIMDAVEDLSEKTVEIILAFLATPVNVYSIQAESRNDTLEELPCCLYDTSHYQNLFSLWKTFSNLQREFPSDMGTDKVRAISVSDETLELNPLLSVTLEQNASRLIEVACIPALYYGGCFDVQYFNMVFNHTREVSSAYGRFRGDEQLSDVLSWASNNGMPEVSIGLIAVAAEAGFDVSEAVENVLFFGKPLKSKKCCDKLMRIVELANDDNHFRKILENAKKRIVGDLTRKQLVDFWILVYQYVDLPIYDCWSLNTQGIGVRKKEDLLMLIKQHIFNARAERVSDIEKEAEDLAMLVKQHIEYPKSKAYRRKIGLHQKRASRLKKLGLTDAVFIAAGKSALAAKKHDGTIVTCGDKDLGGSPSATIRSKLTDVKHIAASNGAFAATKNDGTVVVWGSSLYGGNPLHKRHFLTNVDYVVANTRAFAAKKRDGTVVTWGDRQCGGDPGSKQSQLTDVEYIIANNYAFAAKKKNGTVVAWGDSKFGGELTRSKQSELVDIVAIGSSDYAFAAIRVDGITICWGNIQDYNDAIEDCKYPSRYSYLPRQQRPNMHEDPHFTSFLGQLIVGVPPEVVRGNFIAAGFDNETFDTILKVKGMKNPPAQQTLWKKCHFWRENLFQSRYYQRAWKVVSRSFQKEEEWTKEEFFQKVPIFLQKLREELWTRWIQEVTKFANDGMLRKGSSVTFTHPKYKVHLKGVVWNKDGSKAEVVIVNSEKALKLDCLGECVTIPLNDLQFMDI